MLALVAVALANADGRAGRFLSELLARRADRRRTVAIAFGAFGANALIAAVAGSIANRMIGQGVVALLLALALLTAAGALVWRGAAASLAEREAELPAPLLAARLLLVQFGDRSHVLIGALAATSGAGVWAAAGGFIGWVLALLPVLAFGPGLTAHRAASVIRWGAAAILLLWGVRAAMTAFGL